MGSDSKTTNHNTCIITLVSAESVLGDDRCLEKKKQGAFFYVEKPCNGKLQRELSTD